MITNLIPEMRKKLKKHIGNYLSKPEGNRFVDYGPQESEVIEKERRKIKRTLIGTLLIGAVAVGAVATYEPEHIDIDYPNSTGNYLGKSVFGITLSETPFEIVGALPKKGLGIDAILNDANLSEKLNEERKPIDYNKGREIFMKLNNMDNGFIKENGYYFAPRFTHKD